MKSKPPDVPAPLPAAGGGPAGVVEAFANAKLLVGLPFAGVVAVAPPNNPVPPVLLAPLKGLKVCV